MNRRTIILTSVPLSAFDATTSLSLRQIEQDYTSFVPIGSTTANGVRINFDGFLKTSPADPRAAEHRSHVQPHLAGAISIRTRRPG
jgi:hypothetical protein